MRDPARKQTITQAGLCRAAATLELLLFTAGAGFSMAHAATDSAARSTGSLAAIAELIGDARCDSDAQCRTIAVGANPCGGPDAYLPWSTQRTDAAALKARANRHAVNTRKMNERSGMASTCEMVMDPGAHCTFGGATAMESGTGGAGVCRLRPTRPSGAGAIR